MNKLMKFDFEGHTVRIRGEMFIAKDVCAALGLFGKTPWDQLDDDERGTVTIGTLGGLQEVTALTEAGVYRLALRSRKAAAKRFQRWLAHEVIPTIRRTGGYGTKKPSAATSLRAAEATFKVALRIAKLFKLDEAKAIISANAATEQLTGCNLLNLLAVTGIPSKPPAEKTEPIKEARPAEQQGPKYLRVVEEVRQEKRARHAREKKEDKLVQEQIDLMQSSKRK